MSHTQRKEIEDHLSQQGENVIQHMSDLSEIISSPGIPQDSPIKLQASGYLSGYIRKTIKNVELDNSEIQYSCECLVKLLLSQSILNNIKVQLQNPLENLLNIDSQREKEGLLLVSKFSDICITELQKLSSIDVSSQAEINGLFLVIAALFKNAKEGVQIFDIFKATIQILSKIVSETLIRVLKQMLDTASGTSQPTIAQDFPQIELMNIQQKLFIVKTWTVIHLQMLKKYKKLNYVLGLKAIASFDEYARLFQSILKFFVPPIHQLNQSPDIVFEPEVALITQSGDNSIDLLVNEIKSKVLSCLKIIWTYILKKKPKNIYSSSNPYILCAQMFLPKMMDTLIYLGSQRDPNGQNFEQLLLNGHINQIVKTSIDILCSLSGEPDFQIFFVPNAFKLYLQIVLPYLKISEQEKDDIDQNPMEFVNFSVDICQTQKSKTYKSQSAKLLECIIDKIDGMLTFCVNLNIEIIQNLLAGDPTYIQSIIQKFNLNFSSNEDLMDVCLISLTIMSYALVKRPDLMEQVDNIIIQHLSTLIGDQSSTLIKSRMCLFFAFYLDQLLTTAKKSVQEEYFEKILYFLLTSLKLSKNQKIVSLQALDALNTQINEQVLSIKIQQNFEWIIETLSSYNENINLQSYFDFLAEFIKTHYQNFTQDNLIRFMQSLVKRIQTELQQIKEKSKKKTLKVKQGKKILKQEKVGAKANIRINKCWNTIRFIAEHDYFAEKFLSIVEETLLPLFEYLVDPNLIDFDDDIIFCLSSLIKKSKKVSPVLKKIFPYLPKFQLKYKGIFGNLLQTINAYIVYGKEFFEAEDCKENLGLIFEMSNLSMFNKEQPILLGNNMEGALLLHMIFQNLDGPIIKGAIGDILTNTLARLKDIPMSQTFKRVLLEVFYSAMLLDVNLTIEFLSISGYLDQFFKLSFESWKSLKLAYERKLFALAMTNFLFNCTNMPANLQSNAGYFLRETVNLLIRQQRFEQALAQQAKNNKKKKGSDVNPMIESILMEEENMKKYAHESSDEEEEKKQGVPTQIFDVIKEGNDMKSAMEIEQDITEEQQQRAADSDFKQEEYDLQFNVKEMITRINEVDEFEYFTSNFKKQYALHPDAMSNLINTEFSVKQRDYLKTILASKRIHFATIQPQMIQPTKSENETNYYDDRLHTGTISDGLSENLNESSEHWVPRKIIKAKRRVNPSQTITDQPHSSQQNPDAEM